MYSPKIKEDLIPVLYKLAKRQGKPMTRVVDSILRKHLMGKEKGKCLKKEYESTDTLRKLLSHLHGKKFRLDCGHHVTFGYYLGNDITILNGKHQKIICSECGH